jgi:uncharacterized membrane protein
VTDAVLVRAPVGVTYRTLTDLDGWPRWHRGCTSVRMPADGEAVDRHALVLPGGRRVGRRSRLTVDVHGWRHDVGVRWDVRGDVRGDVMLATEWWFEERSEGVVVHHVVHAAPAGRRGARRVQRHRDAIMLLLQAMKDHLELAVDVAAGRVP